jgi:DNA repair exonuclease SbcCD ATPase subunit
VARRDLDLNAFDAEIEGLNYGEGLGGMIQRRDQSQIVVGSDTELSPDEQIELEECEAIIERGLQTFYEVGAALLRVRELRLYRIGHSSFEAYCAERWGISRPRAYQFIEAAEVRSNLSTIVDTLPMTESQARPLARLEPDQQREAWQQALQRAHELGQRLTAALVEAIVKEMHPAAPAQPAQRADPAPPAPDTAALQQQVEHWRQKAHEWEQRHETTRQALEAMRRRAIQAEMQLETEQRKVEQLQQQVEQWQQRQE